jgi:uncharacterized protein YndB with AHSA1/START domain
MTHKRTVAGAAADAADREIVMTRTFRAPRDKVFEVWTNPDHIGQWWGPDGFTTTTYEMDVKPGGVWRYMMHGPDGTDFPNRIVYTEVVKPERLVYKHGTDGEDEAGYFQVTVTFVEQNDRTEIIMRMLLGSAEERARLVEYGAVEGGKQTLGRLAEYVESL